MVIASAVSQGASGVRPATGQREDFAECGIAIEADVDDVLASEPLFARLSGQLGDALGRRLSVSLLMSGLHGDNAASRFESLCRRLGDALDAPGTHTSALEITIKGKDPDPILAWRIRNKTLGTGALNIVGDERSVAADDFWQQLWQLREEPLVAAACWPHVRSPCQLLTPECGGNVLPGMGLQAPSESAWVATSVSLQDFTDACGELDEEALAATLNDIVAKLETIHRIASWPTAAMQYDAWMNRRLAIQVRDIGDYAVQHGLDPEKHESLQSLRRILLRIRRVLRLESLRVARSTEMLPAIDLSNPARALGGCPTKDGWEQRWLRAVDRTGVRHRNLLVLSPWSLFPSRDAATSFRDLAPLLRLADACVFRDRPSLSQWNVNQFKHFHQGVWALTHHLESNALVAERL